MVVARIVIKEKYEKKNDLVLRSYVRALRNIGDNPYIEDDKAYLYGIIGDDNKFHELLTGEIIYYSNYEFLDENELKKSMDSVSVNVIYAISQIIKNIIFNKNSQYDILEMEELAKDRAIEFDAYIKELISHNPYSEPFNGYNNFAFKCSEIQKVKKMV